jgi:hypothetical protein
MLTPSYFFGNTRQSSTAQEAVPHIANSEKIIDNALKHFLTPNPS